MPAPRSGNWWTGGYAREIKLPRAKRARYEVGHRFYNIYFLLRFSRSNRQRLERLVAFLHELFGTSGMRTMYPALLETLRTSDLHTEVLSDWLEVAAGYVASDQDFPARDDWRSKAIELANSLVGTDARVVEKIEEAFASRHPTTQPQTGEWLKPGIELIGTRHFSDAIEVFRQATEAHPENLFARLMLGISMMASERFDDANTELEHFLARFCPDASDVSRVLVGSASGSRCFTLFKMNRIDDAMEELTRLTKWIESDVREFLRSMAANLYFLLGSSLATSNRLQDAVTLSSRMTNFVHPDDSTEMRSAAARLLKVAGDGLWKLERSEEAFGAWQRVVEYVHVDDPAELRMVAVGALAMKGTAQLREDPTQDVTTDGVVESTATWLAMTEYIRQEDPQKIQRMASALLVTSGDVLSAYGRFCEAESACKKAMELDPTCENSRCLQAEIILRRGEDVRLDEAEKYASRAVELAPEKPQALHTLSNVLVRRGKTKESLDCLERLLRIDGESGQLSELSGMTHALIRGVAAGHAKRVKRMIEESGLAESMEPLWHAVRAELGEELEPLPAEIMDTVRVIRQEFSQN